MASLETLFRLIKSHRYDEFRSRLEETDGIDVNFRDQNGNYLIQYAILFNQKDIVSLLISKGSRLDITDSEGRSVIYTVLQYDYLEILKLLLHFNRVNIGISLVDIRDRHQQIPIHYAIMNGNLKAIEMLIAAGSDLEHQNNRGLNSLHLAVYGRRESVIKLLLDSKIGLDIPTRSGETALHLLCNFQLVSMVKKILTLGADPNLRDYVHELTPLSYAINLNNLSLVHELLIHNADPNIPDVQGNNAVHYTILEQNYEMFSILLTSDKTREKIDVNLPNVDGNLPIHLAAMMKNEHRLKFLKKLLPKTKMNLQNSEGQTPLHLIIKQSEFEEVFEQLRGKKLDLFINNRFGDRPIDLLPQRFQSKMIDLLVSNYLELLKRANGDWPEEWQNICRKSKWDAKEKKLLNSLIPGNRDLCRKLVERQIKREIDRPNGFHSYPKRSLDTIKLENSRKNGLCTYVGLSLDIIVGLIYLMKQHPTMKIPLISEFDRNEKIREAFYQFGISVDTQTEFLNFELVWMGSKLHFPSYFDREFTRLMKLKNIDYIAVPIGIQLKKGSHSNFLFYDKKRRQLERFEPNGSEPPRGFKYHPEDLDEVLEGKFRGLIGEIEYFPPSSYLPKIGFQYLDSYDQRNRKIGDPPGFCAAWTTWYIDMRMKNPSIPRDKLLKKIIQHVRRNQLSFKNIIRQYSLRIVELRDSYLVKIDRGIDDWVNGVLEPVEIERVVQQLKREVNLLRA